MADFLGISTSVPSLGDLAGAAGDIVDKVVGDFLDTLTGNGTFDKLYQQDESNFKQYSETKGDRRAWHTIPTDNSQPAYFFLLKYQGKVIQVPFNINPQRETITEPHATTTQFTQGGGKLISSEGGVTKEITISGTCGLYPGQRKQRLPDSGIGSGFEAFKNLQNVFRKYIFLRRYGDLTKGLQLIYVNRRRQESWVVEPKSFTSEDAIEHNYMMNYTITLETLYPYDDKDTKGLAENLLDAIPGWRQLSQITQRLSESVDALNAAAGQISAIVDGFLTTVMKPVVSLTNSYADVVAGRLANVANFKRDSVKGLIQSLNETHAALEAAGQDALAHKVAEVQRHITQTLLNDEVFDKSPNDQAAQVSNASKSQALNFTSASGKSVSVQDALDSGALANRPDSSTQFTSATAVNSLPGSETYQKAQADASAKNLQTVATIGGSALDPNGKFQVSRFSSGEDDSAAVAPKTNTLESQLNWDSSWDSHLSNINEGNASYRTATVNFEDSIQTLAFRLLGDHARWPEIVMLNNLRYPYLASQDYITANSLKNVVPFGGKVIYAVPKTTSSTRQRVWRNETAISVALSPFERSLGNDILIDEKTGDIVWTANDIALVYGVANVGQFIRKKVLTKKQTLRRSLRFGFSSFVGVSTGATTSILKAETQSAFDGDERIVSADMIEIKQTAQSLIMSTVVRVRDQQDPIIVTSEV